MKDGMYTFADRMRHANMHWKCMCKTLMKGKNPMFYIKGLWRTFFSIKY
jgi:hypothetical protein